jgi:alpha-glucoside transport system substrate-binding protein
VPETLADLEALSQQVVDDGGTPWCMADNEGWIGTDWVEEMVLRTAGADVYDDWITHEIPFDAPEIRTAFEAYESLVLADGRVLGGREAVSGLEWQSVVEPLRTGGCLMYRQGSFFRDIVPEDVTFGEDGDINTFYLPPGENGGEPVLGFGDQASLLTDNPAAVELLNYLAQADSFVPWAEAGSFLSPHQDFDTSLYPDDVTREDGEIVGNADPFRFDASDLMPASVGAGSFWEAMLNWSTGSTDLDSALSGVETSWPSR